MEKSITVKSHRGEYLVHFEQNFQFLEELKKKNSIWVIDQNILRLYGDHFKGLSPDHVFSFEATEAEKTLDSAARLLQRLAGVCKRNTPFISVGGGITQDVTGFAASVLFRGLNWIFIPTTLLAQADSCIGSKTSLNFNSYKNLIGTFYPPKEIFLSCEFLKTLTANEIASGRGEIVKLFLMKAKSQEELLELADKLEKNNLDNLLYEAILIKKEYIEEDEFDEGRRKHLNYGHCFGHALESVTDFSIPHGLAVVIGMMFAEIHANRLRMIDSERFDFIFNHLLIPAFRSDLVEAVLRAPSDRLWEAMLKDKKRTSGGGLERAAAILPKEFSLELVQDLIYPEFIETVNLLKYCLKPSV